MFIRTKVQSFQETTKFFASINLLWGKELKNVEYFFFFLFVCKKIVRTFDIIIQNL